MFVWLRPPMKKKRVKDEDGKRPFAVTKNTRTFVWNVVHVGLPCLGETRAL
jgi:hypothetical protein